MELWSSSLDTYSYFWSRLVQGLRTAAWLVQHRSTYHFLRWIWVWISPFSRSYKCKRSSYFSWTWQLGSPECSYSRSKIGCWIVYFHQLTLNWWEIYLLRMKKKSKSSKSSLPIPPKSGLALIFSISFPLSYSLSLSSFNTESVL